MLGRKGQHSTAGVGFTQVELLVVIGVIALLAAVLLPSVESARRSAKPARVQRQVQSANVAGTTTEACCFATNCEDILPAICISRQGRPRGPGSSCNQPEVCSDNGACCLETACFVTTVLQCQEDLFGTFLGFGTDCTPNPCLPTGACCADDCSIETRADCESIGGPYLGDGSQCEGDLNQNHINDACEDAPCEDCGPGEHWVDQCRAGVDLMPTGALVGISTNPDSCEPNLNLVMAGPVAIRRSGPLDDSQNFPGTRPIDKHLDVLDTEIVSMQLTGGGITLRAGAGMGHGLPLMASLGAIAELAEPRPDPLLATSFFDVFFEIEDTDTGLRAYNQEPLRVKSEITCVPPDANYLHPTDCVKLFDAQGNQIGNLTSANHFTYPACCSGQQCTELPPQACEQEAGKVVPDCLGDGDNNGTDDGCEQEACCRPSGQCVVTTPSSCRIADGVPHGPDSQCKGDGNNNNIYDACETDQPCEHCGPGSHWIDQCPGGTDIMPTGALVGIAFQADCVADVSAVLAGPAHVARTGAMDDSQRFFKLRPVDNHLDVIDTEIVSLELTGGGMILRAGGGNGQGGILQRSFGAIAEDFTDATLGHSFFNVFFEVDLGGGQFLYNQFELMVEAEVTCLPAQVTYIHLIECVPLYSTPFAEPPVPVAYLTEARHGTYPTCGSDTTGDCGVPHDTPFCNKTECCQRVCSIAALAYCCTQAWDVSCVAAAEVVCNPGACCFGPECFVTDRLTCASNDGVYQGNGTVCTPTTCAPPTEACCLPGGGCRDATPDDCQRAGGVSQGANTRCQGDRNRDGIDDSCAVPPCAECGPGPHWIHQPPCPPGGSGQDTLPSGAYAGIDTNGDCIADINFVLGGPVTIRKKGPADDSANYPGLRPIDGHLDVIETEILAMNLTGGGMTLIAGAGLGAIPLAPSTGAIAEQLNNPALADSFFDVFFEISDGLGFQAYNRTAVRVATKIDCLPPDGLYTHITGCTPLYSSPSPTGGTFVGNLVSANHFTYPACCFGNSCVKDVPTHTCEIEQGTVVPDCLGDGNNNQIDDACECGPTPDGSSCRRPACPTRIEQCQPRCVTFDPATGRTTVRECDCVGTGECHVELGAAASTAGVAECVVPDNGSGTVTLPPAGCDYLSPDQVHMIIDGLPPGTTIELAAIHKDFICREPGTPGGVCSFADVDCTESGGSLGGEKECSSSTLQLNMNGTGDLGGFNRAINLPVSFETHVGPRNPGDPVQSFDSDMFRLFGQLPPGDPDFDLLRIVGGTDFGLPSPGHTTLTQMPGGNWAVDSFFDITYRIDFVGAPGGPLAGRSGSTTATIRMQTATGLACRGGCADVDVCRGQRIQNPDGTVTLCCDCAPEPTQACCLRNGECVDTPLDRCLDAGGRPQGPGTTCAQVRCGVVEVDQFPNTAAAMELQIAGGGSELIHLSGPTTVHVFFEGANEGEANDSGGNGLDDVATEMVDMQLAGFSQVLQSPVLVRLHPTKPSRGQIEETANTQAGRLDLPPFAPAGTASSFFDVFFEIEVAGRKFHTQTPKRMSSVITHKPPAPGNTYESPEKIPLLDEQGGETPFSIGAGRHIPRPAVEKDFFPNTAAAMELQIPEAGNVPIALSGPTTVHVFFEGANEGDANDNDGNGLDEVQTEMVDLQLTGNSPFGPVLVRLNPAKPSRGQIEETAQTQAGRLDLPPFAPSGTASSFFDVFFEIEVMGRKFHTQTPKRMSSVITHKPPAPGNTYENPEKIPLLDENGVFTGITIGAGRHTPNPQCGSAGTGDCFTPHDTPFCNKGECCERVCSLVPECCTNRWNQLCAGLARDLCEPTQACCMPSGSCKDAAPAVCELGGGTPQGEKTTCENTRCPRAGDCNHDGHVDMRDIAKFLHCFTGSSGGPAGSECRCADLDNDGDIDLEDWKILRALITGP